jgi:hypothetical protein
MLLETIQNPQTLLRKKQKMSEKWSWLSRVRCIHRHPNIPISCQNIFCNPTVRPRLFDITLPYPPLIISMIIESYRHRPFPCNICPPIVIMLLQLKKTMMI